MEEGDKLNKACLSASTKAKISAFKKKAVYNVRYVNREKESLTERSNQHPHPHLCLGVWVPPGYCSQALFPKKKKEFRHLIRLSPFIEGVRQGATPRSPPASVHVRSCHEIKHRHTLMLRASTGTPSQLQSHTDTVSCISRDNSSRRNSSCVSYLSPQFYVSSEQILLKMSLKYIIFAQIPTWFTCALR